MGKDDPLVEVLVAKSKAAEKVHKEAYDRAKATYNEAMKGAKDKETKKKLKEAYDQACSQATQEYVATREAALKEYEQATGQKAG